MAGSGTMARICGATWLCSSTGSTPARTIASARFILLMSHPPTTMSFGSTHGTMELNGACTSSPFTLPMRHVDDCSNEPK
jgi:hypothetical protein